MAVNDATTLTVIDALLKVRQMKKEITNEFNTKSPLLTEMKEKLGEETGGGRSVEIPLRLSPNHAGAGVRGDMGAMARSVPGTYQKFTVPIYPLNMSSSIGAIAQVKSEKDIQSLKSVLDAAQDDIKIGFPLLQGKLLWGNGDGVLARINGAPNLATMAVTVDEQLATADNTYGTLHLDAGMWLEASSSRTATLPDRAGVAQIVTVDSSTQITVQGSIADWADNDFLVLPDALNNVTDGIMSVHDTFVSANDSYLGLARSTYTQLKPVILASIGAANIEEKIVNGLMQARQNLGEAPTMGLTDFRTYTEVFIDAKTDRRFTNISPTNRKYALGIDAVTVTSPGGQSVEFFIDRYVPGSVASTSRGMFVIVHPPDWKFVRANGKGPDWYRDEAGNVLHQIPGTYGKRLNYLDVYNTICEVPGKTIFGTGITLSA